MTPAGVLPGHPHDEIAYLVADRWAAGLVRVRPAPLDQLALVAVPQWLVLAVAMTVIVRGDRARASAVSLLLGIGVAIGFAVVHLLPFSTTSYWDLQPSLVSWLLAWLPAALGLAVAALAWSQWSQPRRSPVRVAADDG